jgi:hypothetical protein
VAMMVGLGGCVVDVETSDVDQADMLPPDCDGCAANGLPIAAWGETFGALHKPSLEAASLWPGSGPLSLCVAFGAGYCVMRSEWAAWMHAQWYGRRLNIMTDMVKCIAEKGYRVQEQGGVAFHGAFGLRPEGLSQTWDYRSEETVTGCLLAQLNIVAGVPICMLNTQNPTNCTSNQVDDPTPFEESSFGGNLFTSHKTTIIGGMHAPEPNKNRRYGTVEQLEDPALETNYTINGGKRCSYNSDVNAESRHATSCVDRNGNVWPYPVTVRVPAPPSTWYYDRQPPPERPSNWPPAP